MIAFDIRVLIFYTKIIEMVLFVYFY